MWSLLTFIFVCFIVLIIYLVSFIGYLLFNWVGVALLAGVGAFFLIPLVIAYVWYDSDKSKKERGF
jgi:hypothetical protein